MTFQNLKYGWVALVGIAITGVTIYVTDNERKQVQQIDIIELIMGVEERCLMAGISGLNYSKTIKVDSATTNKVWFTNSSGVISSHIITNLITTNMVVTNSVLWMTDTDLINELDSKIKVLILYYIDTNTFDPLTVASVFSNLNIGDGTNQFTRTPEIAYPARTNYVVDYVTYFSYPADPTNIIYTSSVPVSVVYSTNVTVTTNLLGDVQTNFFWTTNLFNTPSVYPAWTNSATYGDVPWQIYAEDLEERYKVLNSLELLKCFSAKELFPMRSTGREKYPWPDEWKYSELFYGSNTVYLYTNTPFTLSFYAGKTFQVDDYFELGGVKYDGLDLVSWVDDTFAEDGKYGARDYIQGLFFATFPAGTNISADVYDTIGMGVGISGDMLLVRPGFEYCTNRYWLED